MQISSHFHSRALLLSSACKASKPCCWYKRSGSSAQHIKMALVPLPMIDMTPPPEKAALTNPTRPEDASDANKLKRFPTDSPNGGEKPNGFPYRFTMNSWEDTAGTDHVSSGHAAASAASVRSRQEAGHGREAGAGHGGQEEAEGHHPVNQHVANDGLHPGHWR